MIKKKFLDLLAKVQPATPEQVEAQLRYMREHPYKPGPRQARMIPENTRRTMVNPLDQLQNNISDKRTEMVKVIDNGQTYKPGYSQGFLEGLEWVAGQIDRLKDAE